MTAQIVPTRGTSASRRAWYVHHEGYGHGRNGAMVRLASSEWVARVRGDHRVGARRRWLIQTHRRERSEFGGPPDGQGLGFYFRGAHLRAW
jgi:hypothetical protein